MIGLHPSGFRRANAEARGGSARETPAYPYIEKETGVAERLTLLSYVDFGILLEKLLELIV